MREGEDGRELKEEGEIDLDALRMRALVKEEMQYVVLSCFSSEGDSDTFFATPVIHQQL